MFDRGLMLTLTSIRRQLAAMPHDLYLIRLIHQATKRPFPGERLWTASQLIQPATVRFLRVRNREGCDIYIHPFVEEHNAGYVLVDLDDGDLAVISRMRANGHDPCVVLHTSPGHLQAWIRVSTSPLRPALATAIGKHLARIYGGDMASTDWRHLGRLAGFTNQKPQRRTANGLAPWVTIEHARAGLATSAEWLLEAVALDPATPPRSLRRPTGTTVDWPDADPPPLTAAEATRIYRAWMERWRIRQRFPQPDWSILDLWIARQLRRQGRTPAEIRAAIWLGSPEFPRGHSDPEDYLRRTLARAAFPAPPQGATCVTHGRAPETAARDRPSSNSTGGR